MGPAPEPALIQFIPLVIVSVDALLVLAFVILGVRLVMDGPHHATFQRRASLAWMLLALLVVMGSWEFSILLASPLKLFLIFATLCLLWPLQRLHALPTSMPGRLSVILAAALCVVAALWTGARWYQQEFRMPAGDCSLIESLKPEEARADAERAVAKDDQHLLAIDGYSEIVPGADSELQQGKRPIRVIPCTSDLIESARHGRLSARAMKYAEIYNRRVVELSGRRDH
jgi:hypothetical protein